MTSHRIANHYDIDTQLMTMSDDVLAKKMRSVDFSQGWGLTGVLNVAGKPVFIKKIPLTHLEMANRFSTRNLYRIPPWYHYGVGSAGFGAFRELAVHRKTTNWVLGGEAQSFVLLHHHRILPVAQAVELIADLSGYVAYWNGSQSVKRYMMDRADAQYELVLFLEHLIPFPQWISENVAKLPGMLRCALGNVDVMRKRGMIHFDAHAQNWLTDGEQLYFTDYGLALDETFELSASERALMKSHANYDYAQVIATVADAVVYHYGQLDEPAQQRVDDFLEVTPKDFIAFARALIRHAKILHQKKLMTLPSAYRKHLDEYLPIIETKNDFLLQVRQGQKRSDQYPARKLNRLLKAAGVLH